MAKQVKKNEYPITPKEYQSILQGLEFVNASLVSLKYESKPGNLEKPVKIGLSTKTEIKNKANDKVVLSINFKLTGKSENRTVMAISGEYFLDYISKKEFTAEFLEVYNDISLKVLIWPYLRELFANITQRSNIAPFVLPLLKFMPKS